jgi:long-subunit fatty acid transport protein
MKQGLARYFFLVTLILNIDLVLAQESNYSNYEVGSKATMLGGSVTAGINDISSIYYNPGALSFIENSSVSLETATLFGSGLKIENGAGQDINIKSNFLDIIPSLIGGIVKSKKAKDWIFSYAAITVNSSFIEFNVRNTEFIDVLSNSPGTELYEGIYDYTNKIRENWIGASASKKVNKNFGIGLSVFGVYFSQDYNLRQTAVVSEVVGDTIAVTLARSSLQRDLRFRSAGLVLKFGAVYKFDESQLGLTITSPTLNLDIFAKGDVSQTISTFIPSIGILPKASNLYGGDLTSYHRTPLVVSLGYKWDFLNAQWSTSVSYYTAVKEYVMLATNPQIFTQPELTKPSLKVFDEAQQVVNLAVGMIKDIRTGLSLLAGFKTDFNYSSTSFLNSDRFIPKMSYWNLYHFTGGVIWYTKKVHLTLGGDYAFGISKGDLQQVNLSDPTEANLLFGERMTNTRTFHNQISVVLGFSYNFNE